MKLSLYFAAVATLSALPGRNLVKSSDVEGTCGGGYPGNGICANPKLCCSSFGYCGTSDLHCNDPAPKATCGDGKVGNGVCPDGLCCSSDGKCGFTKQYCKIEKDPPDIPDSRMIGYLENWKTCPSEDQLRQYTHVMIGFAITYQWDKNGEQICSKQCKIDWPYVCGNQYRTDLIQKWRADGKKVIISFGGGAMGGSWNDPPNGCWEHCFGKEKAVVERLTEIVDEMGLDGVDIDYEYFYKDDQGSPKILKASHEWSPGYTTKRQTTDPCSYGTRFEERNTIF